MSNFNRVNLNETANVVSFPVAATAQNNQNEAIILNAYQIAGRRFANVPLDQMEIDFSYQRISSGNMMKIAKNWDIKRCGMLIVNFRDGAFYIIDGQHRMQAAKMNGVAFLPCEIHVGLTQEQEAEMFARQNQYVTRLTPVDVFKANLVIGEPIDVAISELCKEFKIMIGKGAPKRGLPKLGSISAARDIVIKNGQEGLRWVFSTINRLGWGSMPGAHSDVVLSAFHQLYEENKKTPNALTRNLTIVCTDLSPKLLVATAKLAYSDRGIGDKSATVSYLKKQISELRAGSAA